MKKYFGRVTEIKLLDGEVYKFGALLWTNETKSLIEKFSSGNVDLDTIKDAVVMSLSYFNEVEKINELFETGAIPLASEDEELFGKIMGAMVKQKTPDSEKKTTS